MVECTVFPEPNPRDIAGLPPANAAAASFFDAVVGGAGQTAASTSAPRRSSRSPQGGLDEEDSLGDAFGESVQKAALRTSQRQAARSPSLHSAASKRNSRSPVLANGETDVTRVW